MSEVKLPAPVKATLVDDVDEQTGTPGAFGFYINHGAPEGSPPAGLIYVCPCGCGLLGGLAFRPGAPPAWHWDGNREAPTLSPSVHHVGHWHGWLRAGMWLNA